MAAPNYQGRPYVFQCVRTPLEKNQLPPEDLIPLNAARGIVAFAQVRGNIAESIGESEHLRIIGHFDAISPPLEVTRNEGMVLLDDVLGIFHVVSLVASRER